MAKKSKKTVTLTSLDALASIVETPVVETVVEMTAEEAVDLAKGIFDIEETVQEPDLTTPSEDFSLKATASETAPTVDVTLSAEEVVQADETVVLVTEAQPEASYDGVSFKDLTSAIQADDVTKKMANIAVAIEQREKFEGDKSTLTGKDNIHRTLKKVRGDLVRTHAARVMIAANISEGFINRSLHDGSCYNVYALGKFSDLVDALTGNKMGNAINIAIVRTLFAFKNAGKTFTKEIALAAASDKVRTADATVRKFIISHTVSASTAPTQASSTMQALETLGVVKIVGGSRKNPTYAVCVNAQAVALEAVAMELAA